MNPVSHDPKDELYAGLVHRAVAKGWRSGRKKIVKEELFEELYAVRRSSPESELDETVLSRCLDALVAEGRLTLIGVHPPLNGRVPRGIFLPESAAPVRPAPRSIGVVHHELFRLLNGQRQVTEPQYAGYGAISDWLHTVLEADRSLMDVPLRERSLEIFGKRAYWDIFPEAEKVLDGKGFGGPLFNQAERLHELIRSFPTDPPNLNAHFSDLTLENRSTSWEKGDVLLVVENSATYWSLVEQLRNTDHRIGCVAWGVGWSFSAAVRTLVQAHTDTGHERRRRIREVRYFGDLDKSGLAIPAIAARRAAEQGLAVRPTTGLYKALVRLGTAMPAKKKERTGSLSARELVDWLDDPSFAHVAGFLERGERLAQEWIGRQYLAGSTEWLRDVQ
ncbi:Wadjet anti-phage system protein JetD domain-containing protein [Streptomyces asiaticus]